MTAKKVAPKTASKKKTHPLQDLLEMDADMLTKRLADVGINDTKLQEIRSRLDEAEPEAQAEVIGGMVLLLFRLFNVAPSLSVIVLHELLGKAIEEQGMEFMHIMLAQQFGAVKVMPGHKVPKMLPPGVKTATIHVKHKAS